MTDAADQLHDLVAAGGVAVLTGAGISTESGIPDYRGPTGTLRRRLPMQYHTFVTDPQARQRYWARSHVGWSHIATARPNAGHRAVTALQHAGLVRGLITQNVDGLHRAACAACAACADDVVELHGGLALVVCLCCGSRWPRAELERRLRAANPGFAATAGRANPDGDVDLDEEAVAEFVPVGCPLCHGDLKPDVVFFGENVPRARVERCRALVDAADALLVLGSSLQVLSGLRFVRQAAARGIPVAIVNQGPTRGDPLATLTMDAPLGEALSALVARCCGVAHDQHPVPGAHDDGFAARVGREHALADDAEQDVLASP